MDFRCLHDLIYKPMSGEWGDGEGSIKVIRTANFTNFGRINFAKIATRNIADKKIEDKKLQCGDIIIEKSGGSPDQPVGRVVFFNKEGVYLCNNFTSILRPKKDCVYPKYLHYILFCNHKFGFVKKFQNKTTGIINLRLPKYLKKTKIPLPALAEQKKIAGILDAADCLRQKDKQLIEHYTALSQSLFLEMFGDTWLNQKKWETVLVENIASKIKYSIKAGPFGSSLKKEFYVSSGYKIYGQEQVIKDDLSFGDYYISEDKYKELESCKVSYGDVLISLVGTYGKISVVPKIFERGIINPRLMKISPNTNIIRPDFLKTLLQSGGVGIQLKNYSRGGTMDIINVGIMKKIKIPLPPLALQNKFAKQNEAIEIQKIQAQANLEKSEALFNSLLQLAFKGELTASKVA